MPQIWWYLQISYSLIYSSSHFSMCQCRCPHSCSSCHIHTVDVLRSMVRAPSTMWHPLLHMALGCEVYDVFMYFFFLHYVAQILDWCWCRILFVTCHDSLLDLMRNLLYDVLFVITLHVMFWDPLLYVFGILLLSSYMFSLWNPFCAILAGCSSWMFLCHTDRSFDWEFQVVEYLLEPLLCEGTFPYMIETSSLCTSPLLTALNAATYTILTLGPGDVVPPRQTPLSTAYVFMCWWFLCFSSFPHADVFINVLLKLNFNTSKK